jgi:hypothetical protein
MIRASRNSLRPHQARQTNKPTRSGQHLASELETLLHWIMGTGLQGAPSGKFPGRTGRTELRHQAKGYRGCRIAGQQRRRKSILCRQELLGGRARREVGDSRIEIRLTRTRSATAGGCERELQWTCFHNVKEAVRWQAVGCIAWLVCIVAS